MPYRFLFKPADEQKFSEGSLFNEEKNAIAAVMNAQDLHPEDHFGYIEVEE